MYSTDRFQENKVFQTAQAVNIFEVKYLMAALSPWNCDLLN